MKVGIDNVDIERMDKIFNDKTLLDKIFTEYEINHINKLIMNKLGRLAGLYACKEAVLKAFGVGVGNGHKLHDIEINHMDNGKPYVVRNDYINSLCAEYDIHEIEVNITHSQNLATAICIIN